MAKFTDIEQRLLEKVTDDRLRTSLAQLREAAEDIWADDAPRIVQDYTEHGIAHSERLAGFATQLLDANDGRPLSAQEMYLLLAGVYLHDIGMQCDVVKFPAIKARAEKLGAKFDIEFTARTSSSYSLDEQKAIRKNHQYLAAAWIDHASRIGETVLGPAAKTIPDDLVDDLMDVCMHHAKLPITDCPLTFKFNQTGRKQLVAALLRFSDELDVDGHRVSIKTVKDFALDPRNGVYWWLHHLTKVVFGDRSVITLTIRLQPDDAKQHGSFVHTAFITEFQTKNQPVLTVLAQNGIPIVISSESRVVEYDRAELLPQEIVQALQAMQAKRDPLLTLADEVRTWLQAIRYEVSEPQKHNDRVVNMIATLEQGALKQRVLVRCIDGEILPADVDELDAALDRKMPQGWLISDRRVSDQARERAAEDEAFQIFNLSDFLLQMVWGPYFSVLTALVERDSIPALYVDLACYRQEMDEKGNEVGRDRHTSLDGYIDDWLKERGKQHISLLGEFGTGKTWFCRHYAYRQLERYLQDPANERLPLLITLRAFAKAMTPQQLINDALLEQYKLPFVGSAFEVFQEINRRGKLLLILDGFDEMARQVDYQTVVDNFWQLASLVDESSKVILTSRTEYFRWAKESEKILGGEEYGRRTIVLAPPKFEVMHLEPFNDDQIRQVIIGRKGAEHGPAIAERILNTPNLAEMARKPILVELLLAALDEVSAAVLENPAQVYLYATNKLLLRNIDTQRTFTTTADKLYFLCELAWEMIKSGELRIHYTAIPDRIKAYFGDRVKDQHELDTWDFDLRNQTLLHRDAAGYYEFAHKSLAEYFVAFKFAAELGCLSPAFAQTYCEAGGQQCEIPIKQKDVIGLAETFGAMALTDERMVAVHDLMQGIVAEGAARQLWQIINETKGKAFEQVKYAGGNAITLIYAQGESFLNVELAHTILAGADFHVADLTGADLRSAYLRGVNVAGCTLQNADLREADLLNLKVSGWFSVDSIEWSPDGQWLACSIRDGNARAWNTESFSEIRYLSRAIECVAFSPSGKFLAAGGIGGQICIWDTIAWQQTIIADLVARRVTGLCWLDNDETLLISTSGGEIIRVDRLHKCVSSRARVANASGGMALNSQQKELALGCEGIIVIFDAQTLEMKYQLPLMDFVHPTSMTYSPDGKFLLASPCGTQVLAWTTDTYQHRMNLVEGSMRRAGSDHYLSAIAVAPNGDDIAIVLDGGGTLYRGKLRKILEQGPILIRRPGQLLYSLSFSPDGRYLAGGDGHNVFIWDASADSFSLQQCLHVLPLRMNCLGLRVSGAHGLKGVVKDQKSTLLEFFADCGATLDEEQQQFLTELRKQRKVKQEPPQERKPADKSRRKKGRK